MARRSSGVQVVSLGLLAMLGLLAGCSEGSLGRTSTASETATFSAPVGSARSAGYATTRFVVPLRVTPPSWGPGAPTLEQANFMTWVSADNAHAVRFLVPVSVYRPGSATDGEAPAPDSYLPYLRGLSRAGASLSDVRNAVVGGHSATILTATATESLDGSLGCQEKGLPAPACFGLQPDLVLRLAVLTVRGKTLLIWERIVASASAGDRNADVEAFQRMLDTVAFA
jgi:hypothetical protein